MHLGLIFSTFEVFTILVCIHFFRQLMKIKTPLRILKSSVVKLSRNSIVYFQVLSNFKIVMRTFSPIPGFFCSISVSSKIIEKGSSQSFVGWFLVGFFYCLELDYTF